MHELVILNQRSQIIHTIWIDDADLCLLANAVVAHNPVCNLRPGSGVMPFRALRDAGVTVAIGSATVLRRRRQALAGRKMAALIHKLSTPDFDRWPRTRYCAQ